MNDDPTPEPLTQIAVLSAILIRVGRCEGCECVSPEQMNEVIKAADIVLAAFRGDTEGVRQ